MNTWPEGSEDTAQLGEQKFQALFEHSLDAVLLLDDEGRYIDVNPAACNLLGRTRDELLQMSIWDLTPEVNRDRTAQVWRDFISTGALKGEFNLLHGDGTTRTTEFRAVANILPGVHLSINQAGEERSRLLGQLQNLSARIVEVQEAERRTIARELHDEIGQALTGLKLMLEMSYYGAPGQTEGAAAVPFDTMLSLVNDLMARVREMSLDLRPAMLDDLGLLPTLLWHLDRYTTQTAVRVDFRHAGLEQRFSTPLETAAYRIVQEALTNVARHAKVQEVRVRVYASEDGLSLEVEDHGVGFDLELLRSPDSSGLAGMRERVLLLQGELTILSEAGMGTRVLALLPRNDRGETRDTHERGENCFG